LTGDQALASPDLGKKHVGAPDIAVLTGGQVDGDWSAEEVGGEMDLRGAAAARDADRLILRRFFWPPAAERWAFT
jgi:hypothetical protein